ncbi:MAG TPA: alpha/beta fold hydrolase [Actinomycetota bacterium]|nr:alpha/beta fold hydrolase [Actinomycetota bacterium]
MTTLLLIHAFPLDASMWDAQVEALAPDADVLAPHLPGFGGTAPVGEVLTMDAAADHCAAELDRAGIDRAVVCGLSMGGYAAFSMWRRHPERIEGLLLANTRAEPDDDAGRERRRAVAEKARTEGSEAIAAEPPPLLAADADESMWERIRAVIRRQSGEAIAAASLGMAERPDSRPILPQIDVPTTVLTSEGDQLIPADVTAAMAEVIPAAELVRLEGAGHLSNLEHVEGFNRAVRDLLARVG